MRKLRLALLAILFVVGLTALLAEALLRLFPSWYTEYGNNIYYRYTQDKNILTPEPNQNASFRNSCYNIPEIKINSVGYRSYEWDKLGTTRIAVLGDSFVEGKQVAENTYFAAALRGVLHVDVLNFGVSGYGTIHEYLQYVRDVRSYKPKIVLLFFCTFNDVNGNSCKLLSGGSMLSCASIENGAVVVDEKKGQKKIKSLVNFLYRYYKTSLFIKTVFLQHRIDARSKEKISVLPDDYYAYMPPNGDWPEAWALTEYFLKELKRETDRDNATLILIPVVEHIRMVKSVDEELKKTLGVEAPKGFDPEYPVRWLAQTAQKNNIIFYNPEPFFRRYRDDHNLPYPYFSYRCDGHWNPLTHFLMANLAAEFLINNGLMANKDNLLAEAENNLRRTPREIMGDAAYKAIYEGGFYNGVVK
ncbi:SGNH/GDSL hydrolase family protein [Candidatus Magnetominusculus dajiuhuensis]|uniref:SGNH/GDSL hydrolase family protein n=1 Tax=Candidatus Magnetominusculus dajiuhuensis TaxID=3137712 RepID=UPI003B42C4DE